MADNLNELLHTPLLRPRRSPPDRCALYSNNQKQVEFHHPAYKVSYLFSVSAFDGPNGGIHHRTALLFCGIVAGGVWDGWLSEDVAGSHLADDLEAVLTKSRYYFHLPNPSSSSSSDSPTEIPYKWPVVLSLQDFTFPHERPPPGWTFQQSLRTNQSVPVSGVSQAVKERDGKCVMTGWQDGAQRAHLCPQSEWFWCLREGLFRYNINNQFTGRNVVNDLSSSITLTPVAHTFLDQGFFVFVPKAGTWVPHFLNPTDDLGSECHNVPIDMPNAVGEAFLFANVVLAILRRLQNFFLGGEKRKILIRQEVDTTVAELSIAEIQVRLKQRGFLRSQTSQKRSRNTDSLDELQDGISPDNATSDGSESRIESLRQQGIKKQRMMNKDLECCDNDALEDARKHGYWGPDTCRLCLGVGFNDEEK